MFKTLKGKVAISVFVAITHAFVTTSYGIYDKIIDDTKKDSLDMYSLAIKSQYNIINGDLNNLKSFVSDLNETQNFHAISSIDDEDFSDYSIGTRNIYLALSEMTKNYDFVTDVYIIFKNNNIQISNKNVISPDEKSLQLCVNNFSENTIRKKTFSSFKKTALLYSDSVNYNGKTVEALLYCFSANGGRLSSANAMGVALLPLDKIRNTLKLDTTLKENVELTIYSEDGFAYNSSQNIKTFDYSIIDCDDNKGFSWTVYIKNDFFAHSEVYYKYLTAIFSIYGALILLIILLLRNVENRNNKRKSALKDVDFNRELELNLHISRLFTQRPDDEEVHWFRENVPKFPRPCIAALFRAKGLNSDIIRKTFEQMNIKIRYISNDASGHYVAFFDYRPDGECLEKIKNSLLNFIDKYKEFGINTIISLSRPCMDIDEIYDSCMTAEMMFKYKEYDNLICAGDLPSDGGFSADDYDNDKILRYILAENAFEANKLIYSQWYELSQHPSFGDEIEQLFMTQIGILASAAVKVDYESELPKYDSKLSITELAFIITGAAEDIASHIAGRESESVLYNEVIAYIDDNFTNPDFSQPDIKEKFGISTKIISKIIKQKKNMLFSEYLESLRIGKARYILAHSDIKICDISKMCGYGTNDAFYKAFNKKEGITPGAYRRANAQNKTK